MINTSFAQRLNLSLDKEGFPPKNRGRIQLLAEMVGLTHRGASKWINGESTPPAKKYASLADKLNVNEDWLKTGQGTMLPFKEIETQKIAAIEVSVYDLEYILSGQKKIVEIIHCTISKPGNYFAIKLNSEAMSPRFPSGSYIILDEEKPKDGDFVLANHHDLPQPIFRQLLIVGETYYLNAHNPKFDRLVLSVKDKIIGRLVQAILRFE